MIVRILGEGQYEVPEADCGALDALDDRLVAALDAGDETGFGATLDELIAEIRRAGTALPDDEFAPSDLVVPFADADIAETRRLLAQADSDGETGGAAPAGGA